MLDTLALPDVPAQDDPAPLLGLPSEQSAKKQLPNSVEHVLRTISELLDQLILELLEKRTAAEFRDAFNAAFPKYVRLVRSFGEIMATLSPQIMVRLNIESLTDLEERIRERGQESFGAAMTERALFTVWTLRKITKLVHSITTSNGRLERRDAERDHDFAKKFVVSTLVARLGIDCLVASMQHRRPIYPEALEVIDDFLRAAVDAYAWIRQAALLRRPALVGLGEPLPPLSDEDRQLLDESMSDLALGEP